MNEVIAQAARQTRPWAIPRAVLVGGAIAGTFDIAYAIAFSWFNGVAPTTVLQSVASGLLGEASYTGGTATAMLGLYLHYLISLLLAGAYVLASRHIRVLVRYAVPAGVIFGLAVYLGMRLIVLPLSAFPHPVTLLSTAKILELLVHMLLFGVPIALAARKASNNPSGTEPRPTVP